MEFFPFLFIGLIFAVVVFAINKSARSRKERFASIATSLGMASSGAGTGVIKLHGELSDRNVAIAFHPQGKNSPARMDLALETILPHVVNLKRQHAFTGFKTQLGIGRDVEVGEKVLDDIYEIDAEDTAILRELLTRPDVRRLLLVVAARPFQEVQIGRAGIKYQEHILEKDLTTEYVREATETIVQLARCMAADSPVTEDTVTEDMGSEGLVAESPVDEGPATEDTVTEIVQSAPLGASDEAPQPLDQEPLPAAGETEPSPEQAAIPEADHTSVEQLLSEVVEGKPPEAAARQVESQGQDQIDQIVQRLQEYRLRTAARQVIAALGAQAVPSLIRHLADFRLGYEIKALLKELDAESASVLLEELDQAGSAEATRAILEAVGELKPEGAVEKVVALLRNDEYGVRYDAERTLRSLGLGYEEIDRLKQSD